MRANRVGFLIQFGYNINIVGNYYETFKLQKPAKIFSSKGCGTSCKTVFKRLNLFVT